MFAILFNLAGTMLLALTALVTPLQGGSGPGPGPGPGGDPPAALTDDEKTDLLFMREEEKLARDVYREMYTLWGLPIFRNIANAEQAHMNAVLRLLNRHGLADPVGDNPPGVFANAELQALYTDLIARGSVSVAAALQAGVDIETADIADLQDALARTTHRDITRVYSNLLRASQKHLAAFSRVLNIYE